jgi:hypothetical protein
MRLPVLAAISCLAGCLAFPLLAAAEAPQLDLPSFSHLQHQATEVVDITLGSWPLSIASKLMQADDPESAQMKKVISGLKSITVRSYQFDSDFVYSKADVDKVRKQLARPGWTQLAQVRDRRKSEEVDVYVALDREHATGFAIIASEPRKFTILNIVGSLDLDQVVQLRHHLDLDFDLDMPTADLDSIAESAL